MKLFALPKIAGLFAGLCLLAQYGYAQEKQQAQNEKKTERVVIEKIKTDGAGKEIKVIVNGTDVDVDVKQNVQVEIEEINGERHVTVEVQPMGGDTEVIEWTGEGELPEEVREQLESKGVYLHREGFGDKKGVFIIKDGGEDAAFNWVSDETPGAFLGVVGAQEAKVTVIVDEDGEEQVTRSPASNEDALVVGAVVPGSAAEEAGLKKGDVLRKIDGNTLEDFSDLVEFMQQTEVGQQVAITYERDGRLQETQATLKERQSGKGNVIIEHTTDDIDLDGSGNVFFFKSDDEDVEVHTKHRIVVITRDDEGADNKADEMEFSPEVLPDTELERSLKLREYSLFPNPTEGDLRLRFTGEAVPTRIEINDLSGRNVYRERLNRFDGQYDENIDLSDLPSGIFLLTIEQNDKVYTEQIVVK